MSLRLALATAAVATAAFGAPGGAQAQSAAQKAKDASDMKTLAAYRLTMPTVRKLAAAYENMMPLAADSAFARHVQRDKEGHPDQSAASIEDMAEFFGRYPQIRSAITRAGLTPREFAIANLSLMQSSMVVGFSDWAKAKGQTFDEAASGASAANIALVRANKVELDKVMAKLKAFQDAQSKTTQAKQADDDDEEMPDDGDEEGEEPPR